MYTSHHPIIHHFARQKVVTRELNDVWDVDLMDMSNLAKYNDGVHFVAIFIAAPLSPATLQNGTI